MLKPYLRGRIWWLKYPVGNGKFRYESTGSTDLERAKLLLAKKLSGIEQLDVHVTRLRNEGLSTQIGCAAELFVCADLVSNGYEVFRAVGMHTSCDLVVMKNGMPKRVEVKTASYGKNDNMGSFVGAQQRGKSDILAVVDRQKGIRYYPPIEECFPGEVVTETAV